MRYLLKTLGCKANFYDSQLIEVELQKRGWSAAVQNEKPNSSLSSPNDVRLCIVNSCTVTDEADRQTRRMASRLGRLHPDAKVVVTGCGAEVDPERLRHSKGIHYVIGNRNKPDLVEKVLEVLESNQANETPIGLRLGQTHGYGDLLSKHPMDRDWPTPEASFAAPPTGLIGETSRTRAFLKIQEGCNAFCTYCIIPYGRGPSRSMRPRELLGQIKQLVDEGVQEVIFTGTNIGDYGMDWGDSPALGELIALTLSQTSIRRVRVSSLDPTEITPEIFELMENNPRFCPHFHVSLQSPHSRILRLMKRKYGFEHVKSCLERISKMRDSDTRGRGRTFVGMDIITGFPGETLEEFEWTLQTLAELPWSRLHVFPYSERSGTPATRLPNAVLQQERQRRCYVLNDLSRKRLKTIHDQVLEKASSEGSAALTEILLERSARGPDGTRNWISGYTPNYLRVLIPIPFAEIDGHRNRIVQAWPQAVWEDQAASDVSIIARLSPNL